MKRETCCTFTDSYTVIRWETRIIPKLVANRFVFKRFNRCISQLHQQIRIYDNGFNENFDYFYCDAKRFHAINACEYRTNAAGISLPSKFVALGNDIQIKALLPSFRSPLFARLCQPFFVRFQRALGIHVIFQSTTTRGGLQLKLLPGRYRHDQLSENFPKLLDSPHYLQRYYVFRSSDIFC